MESDLQHQETLKQAVRRPLKMCDLREVKEKGFPFQGATVCLLFLPIYVFFSCLSSSAVRDQIARPHAK